jgi:energy-converting hydrogenase Eha subunit A
MSLAQFDIEERLGRRFTWLMQIGLVVILLVGLARRNTGVIVNAAVGLGIAQLPSLLRRDYNISMSPVLTLWITSAVFLHALGTVGIPGTGVSFYRSVWWWDHLTHALSASVVAAVGYATIRAIDIHLEEIKLPSEFMFVFILMLVIAFGVFWEVIEFTLGEISRLVGGGAVLTQYGIEDTMLDLVFNTIGALIVAIWGTARLNGLVSILVRQLDIRNN